MMDSNNSVEAAVSTMATNTMRGGTLASIIGFLASNEGIAVTGLLITVCGFIVNLYFKVRQDRREQQLQDAKLLSMRAGTPAPQEK